MANKKYTMKDVEASKADKKEDKKLLKKMNKPKKGKK